ncbi:hypothetical protein [Arthrobacter sp. Br18]|uniref:hypothetical protein n=1 Tax=Arthrobacter sp. Br18 TaxID=1312954 RepID=UPI00138AD8AF|nr:hypothetical protein [Arthrobacter sp. Br18]
MVNSITVDAPCTGPYAMPPENGHFVVLEVSVKTAPAQPDDAYPMSFSMDGGLWSVIAPNGTTSNAPAYSGSTYNCLPEAEVLPSSIGPGEQATGKVVLDVVEPEGVLVYGDMTGAGNWEWAYPQG